MTEKYNEALGEQLKKNVWDKVQETAANMSNAQRLELAADVAGIFDPTPASDAVGLGLALARKDGVGALLSLGSMIPYFGDMVGKPAKLARYAPKVAHAVEAVLKRGDDLAKATREVLQAKGLTLEQVVAARKAALEKVQTAMLDARKRVGNCEPCLTRAEGGLPQLKMPDTGGAWRSGKKPVDGNGHFDFDAPKTLPDGRVVSGIEYRNGAPVFDTWVEGGKHQLWEVSGKASTDGDRLTALMRQTNPSYMPPDPKKFTLHHFEDGAVGYVPKEIHNVAKGGVAHTGGNSMLDNKLF